MLSVVMLNVVMLSVVATFLEDLAQTFQKDKNCDVTGYLTLPLCLRKSKHALPC
jgi:hypothetical protein